MIYSCLTPFHEYGEGESRTLRYEHGEPGLRLLSSQPIRSFSRLLERSSSSASDLELVRKAALMVAALDARMVSWSAGAYMRSGRSEYVHSTMYSGASTSDMSALTTLQIRQRAQLREVSTHTIVVRSSLNNSAPVSVLICSRPRICST